MICVSSLIVARAQFVLFSSLHPPIISIKNNQVALACKLQLPMFLHEREAQTDLFAILDEFKSQSLPPVVVHCFTGTAELVLKFVEHINSHVLENKAKIIRFIFFPIHHLTAGTEAELDRLIAAGFHIGITGFVAMQVRGADLRKFVAKIPLDKLMVCRLWARRGGGHRSLVQLSCITIQNNHADSEIDIITDTDSSLA